MNNKNSPKPKNPIILKARKVGMTNVVSQETIDRLVQELKDMGAGNTSAAHEIILKELPDSIKDLMEE